MNKIKNIESEKLFHKEIIEIISENNEVDDMVIIDKLKRLLNTFMDEFLLKNRMDTCIIDDLKYLIADYLESFYPNEKAFK